MKTKQGETQPHSTKEIFVKRIIADLEDGKKHNKKSIERLGAYLRITDKTEVKEFVELAIVLKAREIARSDLDLLHRFEKIVALYSGQVTLSHRTSHSMLLQQYSTPAPISFLAGIFVNADYNVSVFEPSAGNGLLTIAGNPANITVNEIDDLRRSNLLEQGYAKVLHQNGIYPFRGLEKSFDAVLTNPPFGTFRQKVAYDFLSIDALDHLMALRALDTMKDTGKAAIIIGGHMRYDSRGRIQAGRNRSFFNYLYSRYNVKDVINIDGRKLYSRQGTSFNVRLILIDGRKMTPGGAAPLYEKERDRVISSFDDLYLRVLSVTKPPQLNSTVMMRSKREKELEIEAEALSFELEIENFNSEDELGLVYTPASNSCVVLNTVVPDSMGYETHAALDRIKRDVGGDMDEFVCDRLDYRNKTDLCKALSAEQIDAVGMAIYNIEARGQGMIIGDQTGIGKGRVAAAMIRYGVKKGFKPIFITEKANLFSDIYRDLVAIESSRLVPFIINARESKTDIKDEDGNIIYQALSPQQQADIFKEQRIPTQYNFVVATYSQFNSPDKKPEKPNFLKAIADRNIIIMDESHNSSGSSNIGTFMQGVLALTQGVVFLSATFAKRPDNMPVYAMKTSISDSNMTREELVDAIKHGGVALQEVLASQLVAEGQMLRRERSFEGVEVNYITLEEKEQEHKAISDNITSVLRDIINFQQKYVDEAIEEMDDIAVAEGKQVDLREGTSQAGVDNQPYFSKVFNVINQMLFSLKAEAVADRAIMRLTEGKKPVIAFASTMGSFIEQMENERGLPVSDGDTINADFSEVLQKGLEGVLRYTESDAFGKKSYRTIPITDLSLEAQTEYARISQEIRTISTGITISPIDIIVQKLTSAGYKVAEVTGRKYELQINAKTNHALVLSRKKINTNDAFRQFNNNEVDVLLINQSGSTGASAHAIVTPKVSKQQVKQRVMIVLQAELDINTEVQKRGRINRTGQIMKPIYDYVNSAIPAEKRLMMMLQKKLKSLDANTTSNQKSSTKILDVPDFLNKYGDKIVEEYLSENPEINALLDDPLHSESEDSERSGSEDAAHKVSGRVAVLSTKMQEEFYNEISTRYNEYVDYLKQTGDYDLEVEAMDLQAETVSTRVIKVGKGGDSEFGNDSILETVMANVLRKPFTATELENLLKESLHGKDPMIHRREIVEEYKLFTSSKLDDEISKLDQYYSDVVKEIVNERKAKKIAAQNPDDYQQFIEARTQELENAHQAAIEKARKTFHNRQQYLEGVFSFFYVGKVVNYPVETYEGGQELIPAVFIGYVIDKRKQNPYAPSTIKLRFAITNGSKYMALLASYTKDVTAIKGASIDLQHYSIEQVLSRWESVIRESNVDRKTRHIITGNVLQAFSTFKGKLVSFTTKTPGEVRKGILMPEYWKPGGELQQKTEVPIKYAFKIINSLPVGRHILTSNDVSIFRQPDKFKLIVSSSRQRSGDVFLDSDVLALVDGNNFEKISDKMAATLDEDKIADFLAILQDKFGASASLNATQYAAISDDIKKTTLRKRPVLKIESKKKQTSEKILELELEAIVLELELELMEFNV